jgi:predicted dehydrogenase
MCQLTGARPVRVHGIGAKLWADAAQQNYGHLHVVFDDGSVGWYEAGWGPMMSEIAYFVKDVVGPKGAVSIVVPEARGKDTVPQEGQKEAKLDALSDSADIDQHTKTNAIKIHHAEVDANKNFARRDELLLMDDEPDHQALCEREQAYFLRAIEQDLDLSESMAAAVDSLRIVLAADESIRTRRAIDLV